MNDSELLVWLTGISKSQRERVIKMSRQLKMIRGDNDNYASLHIICAQVSDAVNERNRNVKELKAASRY